MEMSVTVLTMLDKVLTELSTHEGGFTIGWRDRRKGTANDSTFVIQEERERRGALTRLDFGTTIDKDKLHIQI